MTTALFPAISTPEDLMSSTHPKGVQAVIQHGSPRDKRPAFISVKPSTSYQ